MVGNVHVPWTIDGDAGRLIELRQRGVGAVPRISRGAGPRDRGDDAGGRRDFAHTMVVPVSNVQVACAIDRHTVRAVQLRGGCLPTISSVPLEPLPPPS